MADSSITKQSLASALKELMEEKNFSKISISDICERCGMSRKNFYYHFKDKYNLLNWIFDTEFLEVTARRNASATEDLFVLMCTYFYDNRNFYRKAFEVKGQNSFCEHFYELLYTAFQAHLHEILGKANTSEFQVNFFADAIAMTVQRWIMDENCMTPEEFQKQLKTCIHYLIATEQDMV